jgi:hypothetical protein
MESEPLGWVEFTVIEAVHRGALRSRQTARQVAGLRLEPAGDALLHEALRRCAPGWFAASVNVRGAGTR